MYLDPPAELAVAAALSGRTDERLAAESLLAAQSDLSRRSASRATRAERAADAAMARASDAARAATDAAVAAEDRLGQLQQEVARRAEVLARVTTVVQTLRLEVGGLGGIGSRLADLVSIEQVTSSGSVVITVEPDGSWSIVPVGFPPASEILRIPGTTIRVHRLIAEQVQALVVAAAADGVRLDGWGYRDSVRQVELRRAHCGSSVDVVVHAPSSSCRPPTARPGRSMHERGLAVDFAYCSTRSSPCYRWLSANAARFGLLNLPSEPWHWSTNGN
jgi:multidrug efflux pump subunit AcrA (membrane-fusion protein)